MGNSASAAAGGKSPSAQPEAGRAPPPPVPGVAASPRPLRRARAAPDLSGGLRDTAVIFDPRYIYHITGTQEFERPERVMR